MLLLCLLLQGNFVADEVDIEIMQRQYRRWSRTKGHSLSMAGAAAAPEQAGPRSQAGLAVEGSAIATPAAVHLSSAAVVGAAGKLTGDQVAAFGFKYQQAPEHTMFGVLVNPQVSCTYSGTSYNNTRALAVLSQSWMPVHLLIPSLDPAQEYLQFSLMNYSTSAKPSCSHSTTLLSLVFDCRLQDFNDDPRDANRLVYLAAELVCVIMHTVFIWMLPIPLFVIVFGKVLVI